MVVLNTALVSLLIPTAILARGISHEQLHKRHDYKPAVGTAPYPTSNNATVSSQAVASQAVVTKVSTINVVPLPVSSQVSPSSSAQAQGSGSQGSSGGSGSNGSNGANSQPAGSSQQCGPATVTVTAPAKTVTVTAGAAGAQAPSSTSAALSSTPVAVSSTPAAPSSTPAAQPASKPNTSTTPQPPKQEEKVAAPVQSQAPQSSPQAAPQTSQTSQAPQQSSAPKKSTGGKKGILYANLDSANAMAGEISWGCNWDSSPIPAVGHASGSMASGMTFVPQLWGPEDVHTSIWAANSQGAEYVMAFNEPNQPLGSGGCGPMSPSDAVAPYESNMKANKQAGQKIISPCVSNDASQWLDTFIGSTSLKPDAVCFHWYGLSLSELQGVVSTFAAIQSKYGIAELWMTEWALNADMSTSDATQLLQWLDSQSGVDRYAYNNAKMDSTPGMQAAYCH